MIGALSGVKKIGGLLERGASSSVGNEGLENIIDKLEGDIASGRWVNAIYTYDKEKMPALVAQAREKYPEMNLDLIMDPKDVSAAVNNNLGSGVESCRFIINAGGDGAHFAVMDCRCINGKTSLILFEPTDFRNDPPSVLAFRVRLAIDRCGLPDCHFLMAEMDIQRSKSECGIFSLALAKKLYIERDSLLRLHDDNINGTLCSDKVILSPDKLDTYLPVTFYKHTQGRARLDRYLSANPQAGCVVINKKNEKILDRFTRNQVLVDGKEKSVSMHRKRVVEYKGLLKP